MFGSTIVICHAVDHCSVLETLPIFYDPQAVESSVAKPGPELDAVPTTTALVRKVGKWLKHLFDILFVLNILSCYMIEPEPHQKFTRNRSARRIKIAADPHEQNSLPHVPTSCLLINQQIYSMN
jgi:hypothetical protein